jgi:hypothetical protein
MSGLLMTLTPYPRVTMPTTGIDNIIIRTIVAPKSWEVATTTGGASSPTILAVVSDSSGFTGLCIVPCAGGKATEVLALAYHNISGITVDSKDVVYISCGTCIKTVSRSAEVKLFAGHPSAQGRKIGAIGPDGPARFYNTRGIAFDSQDRMLICDTGSHTIKRIQRQSPGRRDEQLLINLAGSGRLGSVDASGNQASFCDPREVAVDGKDNAYVLHLNSTVRRVTPDGVVTTIHQSELVYRGSMLVVDMHNDMLYIAGGSDHPSKIGFVDLVNGTSRRNFDYSTEHVVSEHWHRSHGLVLTGPRSMVATNQHGELIGITFATHQDLVDGIQSASCGLEKSPPGLVPIIADFIVDR